MTEQIKDFINRRFTQNCNWQNENSYYFAKILTARFPKLCLYYSPVQGHFVAGHDDIFYDSAEFPEHVVGEIKGSGRSCNSADIHVVLFFCQLQSAEHMEVVGDNTDGIIFDIHKFRTV